MAFDPHDPAQLARYARQLVLRPLGAKGQRALGDARVLVVGAGGLGGPALQYLAAAGVGLLGVADGDRVEASNLQRQVLFTQADIGQPKADVAAARLRVLNPHGRVIPLGAVGPENAMATLGGYDVVLDASDNFATRFLLNDACYFANKPLVHASVAGTSGQLTTFWRGHGPCYRCFFPAPPENGSVPGCAEVGILGAAAGLIGSWQAAEAIKLIVGAIDRALMGRMLMIDAWDASVEAVALPRDPQCPLCGDHPVIEAPPAAHDMPVPGSI